MSKNLDFVCRNSNVANAVYKILKTDAPCVIMVKNCDMQTLNVSTRRHSIWLFFWTNRLNLYKIGQTWDTLF